MAVAAPQEVRDELRIETFNYFLENGIKTEEELGLFVEEYFGYFLPTEHVCPEHTSPMAFLADQFFERTRTSLGFANRGGGKTIITAILNILDALFKPGVEIASAGAIMQQADRGYEYVRKFLFEEPLFLAQLESSIKSETRFRNGSILSIIAGTYHGLNSPHPNKFRCDEIELMPWVVLQEGLQMSIEKKGYIAQDTLTSTRKFQKGTMQRILDEAAEKEIKVYSWCIFEVLEKCTRLCYDDPVHGNCPVYSMKDKDGVELLKCGGMAHNCKGWYKIEDFIKKARLLDKDTWDTQWRNLRPSGAVLVYGDYFKDEDPWVINPFPIPRDWVKISGIDFGSTFVYLKAAQNPVDDTWYVFHEYYSSIEKSLDDHSGVMCDSPYFNRKEWCFADPAGKQAIIDLNRKFKAKNGPTIYSANNDVYGGINFIKALLQRTGPDSLPKLRVFRTCAKLRAELGVLYSHKLDKDGTTNKDVIVKKDDHAADALRYMMYTFHTQGRPFVRTRKASSLY